MIRFGQQSAFFKLIGEEVDKIIECFVIGGSAMMFYGAKEETKDVDMVFMEKASADKIKEVLHKIGFREKKSMMPIFKRYEEATNKPTMMVRGDDRFDLFLKEIITCKMSESIIGRVRETHEFGNLHVKIVSPEDIILLKCATEREKDRIDALSLMEKFNIDWNIVIEESINQTRIGEEVFPVYLYDFLSELKDDLQADIPKDVLTRIRKIAEEEMVKVLKRGKSVVEKAEKKKGKAAPRAA